MSTHTVFKYVYLQYLNFTDLQALLKFQNFNSLKHYCIFKFNITNQEEREIFRKLLWTIYRVAHLILVHLTMSLASLKLPISCCWTCNRNSRAEGIMGYRWQSACFIRDMASFFKNICKIQWGQNKFRFAITGIIRVF